MRLRSRLSTFFDGSMRANAVALVTHQLASATLGFVYWLLAAHLYTVQTVGTSSAVISTLQLVSGLAQLGLVSGMQRFIPRAGRHARRLAVSAYGVATVSAAIAGVIAIWVAAVASPNHELLDAVSPGWIVLAAVAWTLFYLQDGVLVGLREAVWVLVENFAYNVAKIVLLVIGAQLLASSGIVVSWFLPVPFAVAGVTWLVFGRLLHRDRMATREEPVDRVTSREIVASLSADHVGATVNEAGLRLLPLLVVGLLGVSANAYFYQAWMISTVLALVAGGMANSFMAETAADRTRVGANSRAILRTMSLLLLPAAVLLGFGAHLVLAIFGPEYAREGAAVLRLLAIAVPAVMVNAWFIAYLRVMGHIKRLIAMQVLTSVALVGLTWVGLRLFGIAGAGAAYLLTQTGAAFYALTTTRNLLARPGDEGMRRGDWRFLLAGPAPSRVAVLAEGALERSAELLGGERVTRDADVCVVDAARPEALRTAVAALAPGGVCYAEWGIASIARIRSLHRRAGLSEPAIYWPAPFRSSARVWLRVPSDARDLGLAADALAGSRTPSLLRRVGARVVAAVTRIGMLPSLVSVARVGGEAADLPTWLAGAILRESGSAEDLFVLMRTGGAYDESKVNWLVFSRDTGALRWIAKAPRHPDSYASLGNEHAVLERLAREPRAIRTPLPLMHADALGFPLYVQGAISGTPLAEYAKQRGFAHTAKLLAEQLAALVDSTKRVPAEEWRPVQADAWLRRLEAQLEGIGDPALLQQVRDVLAGAGPLPLGWTHNDCTPWNIFVEDETLGVFDWETGDEVGLPAVDLIYCLGTLAFALDDTEGTPRAGASYESLLDPESERGAAFAAALAHYGARLGLSADDLSRLRVVTWLVHTTHDLHNIFDAAGKRDASLLARCVCLPVLQAELRRHHLGPAVSETAATVATPVPAEALFISPHLDDAVLSCGSAIKRLVSHGTAVTVATVFTADLPAGEQPSCLAEHCHEVWGAGDRPFEARREEDRKALAALGAHAVHLGFLDAVYRVRPDGSPVYARNQRCTVDATDGEGCLAALESTFRALFAEHSDAVVFCPAGVGDHVDHTLVRLAVEAVAPERLVYYDEYPYIRWTGAAAAGAATSYRLHPMPDEVADHIAAVRHYTSQLPGLFPSLGGRLAGILRQRLPWARDFLPPAPGDLSPALARMETHIARDGERHGERYQWADDGWAGPFAEGRS
jgi:O-antigen/teichoic acid export membrane protein/LmbE family N-acetylglucosaminyl deacetylase